jgi:hypothetical protein
MGNADGTPSDGEGRFPASDRMNEEKPWLPDYGKIQ